MLIVYLSFSKNLLSSRDGIVVLLLLTMTLSFIYKSSHSDHCTPSQDCPGLLLREICLWLQMPLNTEIALLSSTLTLFPQEHMCELQEYFITVSKLPLVNELKEGVFCVQRENNPFLGSQNALNQNNTIHSTFEKSCLQSCIPEFSLFSSCK